ncbi:MAG: hypothetical protein ACKOFH_10400 [Chthoniobacterales bacterium]
MKTLPSLLLLSLFGLTTTVLGQEEIVLNSTQTPDDVGTFYLDDAANTGEVSGRPRETIAVMDHQPHAIQVGDVGNENIAGRIRKVFLLFRLPDLQGKTIKEARLNLQAGNVHQQGPAPLPPRFLLHAKDWDASLWESDPPRRGLRGEHGVIERGEARGILHRDLRDRSVDGGGQPAARAVKNCPAGAKVSVAPNVRGNRAPTSNHTSPPN